MSEWIDIRKDDAHVARERAKARALRQTTWWQQQIQRGVCHYCEKNVGADSLTMDHVVPVARGGCSTRGNIVPACQACNASKRAMTPAEQILMTLNQDAPAQDDLPPDPALPLESKPRRTCRHGRC